MGISDIRYKFNIGDNVVTEDEVCGVVEKRYFIPEENKIMYKIKTDIGVEEVVPESDLTHHKDVEVSQMRKA